MSSRQDRPSNEQDFDTQESRKAQEVHQAILEQRLPLIRRRPRLATSVSQAYFLHARASIRPLACQRE